MKTLICDPTPTSHVALAIEAVPSRALRAMERLSVTDGDRGGELEPDQGRSPTPLLIQNWGGEVENRWKLLGLDVSVLFLVKHSTLSGLA